MLHIEEINENEIPRYLMFFLNKLDLETDKPKKLKMSMWQHKFQMYLIRTHKMVMPEKISVQKFSKLFQSAVGRFPNHCSYKSTKMFHVIRIG